MLTGQRNGICLVDKAIIPEFREALDRLAAACAEYESETGTTVVLVGGASTTIYTKGLFVLGISM